MNEPTIHDFDVSDNFARTQEPRADTLYHQVFGEDASIRRFRTRSRQKAGHDVEIRFGGTTITIDEKFRDPKNLGVRDDFLVEEWSDRDRGVPGWTVDPAKTCDLWAYHNPAFLRLAILPASLTRLAVVRALPRWKTARPLLAENRGWTTVNWPVSWPTLILELVSTMILCTTRIDSGPHEDQPLYRFCHIVRS